MTSIDVIVPCYRYAHFLRECVASVLTQSIKNVRVLIIDDASPDHTPETAAALAREDSRVTFLQHPTNRGHIATFNEGLDWVAAKYVLLLSADDYLLPGSLHRAVDLMEASDEVGMVFGKAVELDDRGVMRYRTCPIPDIDGTRVLTGREFIEVSGSANIVSTPTAVVRTRVQNQVGRYRPELPHTGDMEMWLRIAAQGPIGVVNAYQAVYRRHSANMSQDYFTGGFLPDLQERRAAIDSFFMACGRDLPDADQLQRRLLASLGLEAIGFASTAFNSGDMESSARLSTFALSVYPEAKRSTRWLKLACKRRLGLRAWRALRAIHGRQVA